MAMLRRRYYFDDDLTMFKLETCEMFNGRTGSFGSGLLLTLATINPDSISIYTLDNIQKFS